MNITEFYKDYTFRTITNNKCKVVAMIAVDQDGPVVTLSLDERNSHKFVFNPHLDSENFQSLREAMVETFDELRSSCNTNLEIK